MLVAHELTRFRCASRRDNFNACPNMPDPPSTRAAVIALLVTAGTAAYSLYSLRPPAPVPADAPASEFSADRAMQHVRHIAQVPHPTGSPANAAAREYLLSVFRSYGLDP
jgi:hypothetical protein